MLRLDYIFSNWILIWFFLYIIKLVKYSPKFIIILGTIEVFIIMIYYIYINIPKYQLIKFIIINFILKVIPLFIVKSDIISKFDIVFSFTYFLVYLLWLFINNITLYEVYIRINNEYVHNLGKNKTFFTESFNVLFR